MALATKCPHCNTIFRVAHDQLKLRGGIVRCGACNEVFDGNAALVEPALKQPVIIDLPSAPTPAPTSSPELEALITTLDARAAGEAEQGEAFDLDLDVDIDDEPAPSPASAGEQPDEELQDALVIGEDDGAPAAREEGPPPDDVDEHLTAVALHDSYELDAYPPRRDDRVAPPDDLDDDVVTLSAASRASPDANADGDGDAGGDPEGGAQGGAVPEADRDAERAGELAAGPEAEPEAEREADRGTEPAAEAGAAGSGPATPVSAGLDADDDEPGFVKRERRRRKMGKAARAGMALGIPLLLAALAAQVLGTFRNPLAAAVPALKPALVSACALAGCTVELPAQIDALSIEQGELQTLADNVFSFSTTLRNGARSAQAWPHIELILNDDAGKPVLRRVFAPREYLAGAPAALAQGFAPRSEQSVKLYFELAQIKASGYHIAVFYP